MKCLRRDQKKRIIRNAHSLIIGDKFRVPLYKKQYFVKGMYLRTVLHRSPARISETDTLRLRHHFKAPLRTAHLLFFIIAQLCRFCNTFYYFCNLHCKNNMVSYIVATYEAFKKVVFLFYGILYWRVA